MTAPFRPLTAAIDAPSVTCACCKAVLYPSEFGQLAWPEFQKKVDDLYSGPVCDNCTDDHATCPMCGVIHNTESPEAQKVSTGETVCSPGCWEDFESEQAEERRFRG